MSGRVLQPINRTLLFHGPFKSRWRVQYFGQALVHKATMFSEGLYLGYGLVLIIMFLISLILVKNRQAKSTRRLPGPWRLPLVGSYFQLRLPFRAWLPGAVRQYGDLFAFRLAGQTWVSLNSTERIREALEDHACDLSGRLRLLWSDSLLKGSGLVLGDGEVWRKHRNLTLRVLKDFGFNRSGMEDIVQSELQLQLAELPPNQRSLTADSDLLAGIAANVICRLVFGTRATDASDFGDNLRAVQTIVQADFYNGFGGAVLLPLLRRCPPLLLRLGRIRAAKAAIEQLLGSAENRVRQETAACRNNNNTYQAGSFLEAVVRTVAGYNNNNNNNNNDDSDFSEGRLAVSLFDLTIAGTDSTGSALKWLFLRLAAYPDWQSRLADELDSVVGDRQVANADRGQLNQLRAFIEETLRLNPPVPTAVVHRAERAVLLSGGYRIPEGAWILPNIQAAQRDPRHFVQPAKFQPERFLDAGGAFQPSPNALPFSVGPRACLGEQLARMEMFLTAARFLQHFAVQIAVGDKDYRESRLEAERLLDGPCSRGLVACPPPFRLLLIRRDGA